ncbi:MAG: DNA polymerase [Acidobacteriota bacterium]
MPEIHYQLINTSEDLSCALALLSEQESIGIDTETTGLDPFNSRIRLIQLGTAEQAFIIDLFRTPAFAAALKPLLTAARPSKVFHNAKFDLKMISHHLGFEVNSIFDTMLASQLISCGREEDNHSLLSAAARFLNIEIDKSQQLSNWGSELTESQLRYAAYDAIVVLALQQAEQIRLRELGLVETAELEFAAVAPIAAMELTGMLLDAARWRTHLEVIEQKHKELAVQLQQALEPGCLQMNLFGEARINLDSPAQVLDALQRMGIPILGTRSVQLQALAREYPIIELLLEYRSLQKALSSYGEGMLKFIHPVTGRIHADFRQIGTPTGRLACHEPNLQQIPHTADYRSCFLAAPGKQLIIADYSQIELRILADWSCDSVLIEALRSGADLHRVTASQMFGVPLNDITNEHRAAAKQLNYGIVYGMGAQGLANRVHSSLREAERLIERYFSTYAGVAKWLQIAGERAVAARQTRTRLGRLMQISYDEADPSSVAAAVRLGKNMPIQGTSADITKRAMMRLYRALAGSSAQLVNNVHDEFVIEVGSEQAEEIAAEVQRQMVAAGAEFIASVPVTVDIKVAKTWQK